MTKTKNKKEQGRTLTELLAVLAIIAVLSMLGLYGYSIALQKRNVDMILNTLQQKVVEIDSALTNKKIQTTEELNKFLSNFTTTVGEYRLSFRASPDKEGDFVSDITYADGQKIKGRFCRELITKMAEQSFVQDVDITLKDEEQEDGSIQDVNIQLNNRYVDLEAVCGG